MDADLAKLLQSKESRGTASSPHLSEDQIAALIDQRFSGVEKRVMILHLNECSDCYEIFSESVAVLGMMEEIPVPAPKVSFFARYAFPLAAVALLLIVFSIETLFLGNQQTIPPPIVSKKRVPPESQIAEQQTTISPAPQAESFLSRDYRSIALQYKETTMETQGVSVEYGFAAGSNPEKSAFRIGINLVRLRASLAAQNLLNASAESSQIADLLASVSGGVEVSKSYQKLNQEIQNKNASDDPYAESASQFLAQRKLDLPMKTGEWIACAGLAALNQDASFFQQDELVEIQQAAASRNWPQGVAMNLGQIQSILKKQTLTERDFKKINSLLNQVSELLSL